MKSIKLLRQIGITQDTYYSNNPDIIYFNFIYKNIEYQVVRELERNNICTYISFSIDKDSGLEVPSEMESLFLNSKRYKTKGDKVFISAQTDINDVAKFVDEYVTEYELKVAPSSYFRDIF